MKAIIPAAGQGTRLYPQTHTKPKGMVRLAGKPILGHILQNISETEINEVIIVVGGTMKEQIIEYARTAFSDQFSLEFVEQENAKGLGHSIYQAESVARGDELLIALGDMLFENGFYTFIEAHNELPESDGSIGVKTVAEPSHYGVVEMNNNEVSRLVEKPDDPPSNFAISGVYIIENSDAMFDALRHLIDNNLVGAGNEFQLTDALQRMVEQGYNLRTFEVEDWYDCGRPETLLKANRVLLERADADSEEKLSDSVVIPPIDAGESITVEASVVGPYVSIDDGATIEQSIVANSIVGKDAVLQGVNIDESIIGSNADVQSEANNLNVGDNSSINF
ncbi:sugar nucleotidyltransferase [Haloferax sp. KTX1]|uniref:sugar nucleotidyltransferase n=1 Tax=Haloferax sp. KTX1 TaxID=2600597 RepID=UPI0011DD2B5D|nr:sugar phosphate nucleotidyltransferase [Haloferax sp. KTX1]